MCSCFQFEPAVQPKMDFLTMSDDALSMILAAMLRLESKTDRIDAQLSSIRDDIGVNMGRADRAHEAADGTRAERRLLSQEVSGMSRQIKT